VSSDDSRLYAVVLIAISLLAGLLGAGLTHFSAPMPGYWDDALEFSRNLRIAGTFTPNFYPAVLGLSLRAFGHLGPAIGQLLMYELYVILAYRIFLLLEVRPRSSMAYAFLLGLCPDMVSGITKVWDIVPAGAAFIALIYCILLVAQKGLTIRRVLATGIVWGFGLAIRPNFLSFIIPLSYAAWSSRRLSKGRWRLLQVLPITLIGLLVMAAANFFAHGAVYWPQNGPYNFFAGANEFSSYSLRTYLNGEPSIVLALSKRGIHDVPNRSDAHMQKLLLDEGGSYIRMHPVRWSLGYSALKLFTMLRPDTKNHRLVSAIGLSRLAVNSSVIVWLILLFGRRPASWEQFDIMNVCIVVSYCIPFLLTNADPRFGVVLNQYLWIAVLYAANRSAMLKNIPVSRHCASRVASGPTYGDGRLLPSRMLRAIRCNSSRT
jgi:hypothetical protein